MSALLVAPFIAVTSDEPRWIHRHSLSALCESPVSKSGNPGLLPDVRMLPEVRALRADDAEALPCRGLHHAPRVDAFDSSRAERLQSRDLRFEVVRFDVDVHAAWMRNALHLYMETVRSGRE